MSNLVSAKAAIRAEIEHAKKGAAYYQNLVVTLEQALEKLDSVGSEKIAPKKSAADITVAINGVRRRGRPPKAAGKAAKTASPRKGRGDLPFTGKDFWPSLISEQPQSMPEVLQSAIARLGISPTSEQKKKLSQRATFALNHLVKTNAISDTGSGRERRFLKK
jgi:hypothetical protein